MRFGPTQNLNVKVLFEAFYRFWFIYSPIGAKFEKSSEKDFNVRILCRTKAQSIPEGLGLNLVLTAKLKKNRKFFYDPLRKFKWINSSHMIESFLYSSSVQFVKLVFFSSGSNRLFQSVVSFFTFSCSSSVLDLLRLLGSVAILIPKTDLDATT